MLTKTDLLQITKAVKEVVREEVGNEAQSIKDGLIQELTMSRMRVQTDIRDLGDRIKNLEVRVTKMHKDLKSEIKTVVNFLDRENLKTLKRVEDHLGFSAS